jgi:hypothetical protein
VLLGALPWSTVGGCACEERLQKLVPDIALDDSPRHMSRQHVGRPTALDVQVGNRGDANLAMTLRVEPADQGFAIAAAPDTLGAGQAEDIALTFTPPTRGQFHATLVVDSNDPDEPTVEVSLSGEGGPPQLSVVPSSIEFGVVNEGVAAQRTVEVKNVGFDTLTGLSAALEVNGGLFVLDTTELPTGLAADESALVQVQFTATAELALLEDASGFLRDTLLIDTDDTGDERVPVSAAVNLAPTAVAVEMVTRLDAIKVGVGKPVVIDGSDSSDPEADAITLTWSLAERPPTSIAALVSLSGDTTRITTDEVGRYRVQLLVTDAFGASATDEVALLPRDLSVVLRWSTEANSACQALTPEQCAALPADERNDVCCGQSDLDLHLVRPNGTLGDGGVCPAPCTPTQCTELTDDNVACRHSGSDCAWNNRAPEWGVEGRIDDPRLDVDDVRGAGPEVISLDLPEEGTYRAVVHYCRDRIGEPTLATVDVFVEGVLAQSVGPELVGQGDAWTAVSLVRTAGLWTFVAPPGVVDAAPADLCAP